jgi:tetratricopeptide (TPR) repeat protein
MKKIIFLTMLSICLSANSQWINKTSCKKSSRGIVDLAIDHLANLEYLIAYGSANAALEVDPKCGSAKLVLAAISSSNTNWGSRSGKLKEINRSKLSSEEMAWYDYLNATNEAKDSIWAVGLKKNPSSPLVNYLGTTPSDFSSFESFASKFPDQAASSYNMIAYGHMNGALGDPNMDQAIAFVQRAQAEHKGPNAYDSEAEILAMDDRYSEALDMQLKAIDFGTFASPYMQNAQKYWAKTQMESISEQLIKNQMEMQDAILTQDAESYSAYVHDDITVTTGDSNLNPFYEFTSENVLEETPISWSSFTLSEMDLNFSPDMKTAVITFEADGAYITEENPQEVVYATRGSSVWVSTDQGWKIMHSSWAPRNGMMGLPDIE